MPARTCIVLGSGGHTTEMFGLLDKMDLNKYDPRHYIVASTDTMSVSKAEEYETRHGTGDSKRNHVVHRIPRSREVRQSFVSTIFTTLWATLYSMRLVWQLFPDLVSFVWSKLCEVHLLASSL
jgi:beta-1,4-N-acetylglucosaminyltransferase